MSICSSILSKKHHLATQKQLKETKELAFKRLLPKEDIVKLTKEQNSRCRVYTPSVTFFLTAALIEQGISGVFPLHHTRKPDFKTGTILGKKDHIISWKKPTVKPSWMTREDYEAFPNEISVREVEIKINQPGYRAKTMVLVSTLLDEKNVSKTTLASLYSCRWFIELSLRAIKETMNMEILRGKTPSMVRMPMIVEKIRDYVQQPLILAASLNSRGGLVVWNGHQHNRG